MLSLWRDAQTRSAIENSGGLGEVFTLPLLAVMPGTVLATLGGVAGKSVSWLFRSRTLE